ncbi:MAG TPA: hydantoinase B/oxoprolinase family protein [Methylomirabilota bacterium]|jgi:N-methylhydantoinase B|nr:hydantoinase B/oxoprolinase family protein [Methylomirabilota bacterium]HEV8676305.1 hydantoinase B/oxoprolinase family protein [Methylomirabilota bacterium]
MDRITLEVIGSALASIAEEMGTALIKASYSSNIKERWDCSTAVFDRAGQVIAQAEHIPMHLGSLLGVVQEILRRYPPERLAPGDIFAANDPYTGGGTHLPDITLAAPVFVDAELFGFVANIAHHADRTGERIRTIYDEGLRIPPIRLVEGGRVREDVMELVLANFALPAERQGDFRAQIAANRLGDRRLLELCRRYGRTTVAAACEAALAYGERKIRAAIAKLPSGTYRFTDHLDGDGVRPGPIPIAVAITVAGDRIHLDFAGTGPQCAGDINVVRLALLATVYYALKAVLDPTIPANGGFYRAIDVEAPEGSIVNARPPAPVAWRTQTCQRIADVIFGALAPVLPERVPAAGNGANSAWVFSGVNPRSGRYYVYLETLAGGAGATAEADGLDAVQVHITNTSNLPVECLELEYPLLVEEYALVDGSGGVGRFRGGLGLRRTIEVLGHEAQFLGTLERAEIAPWGLQGGGPGGCGALVLNPGTPGERRLPSKVWGHPLKPGDRVTIVTPGAGGYGAAP